MFERLKDVVKIPEEEERVIDYWKQKKIFEKSLKIRENNPLFVFFEGPPTANGKPGIHHGLSRIYKDTVLRFKSLNGYYVPRKGGWDTQGLPVEIEVEKMLNIHTKREIEEFGIEKFNALCRESVMKYTEEWEEMTDRIGFWLDLKNAYKTYENSYLETVWWLLKQIYDKGLLYQGYKVVPYCPRCGTTLSSHEVSLGYRKVKDPSVYVLFRVLEGRFKDASLLVWTTTPWTLPSNLGCAINPDFIYTLVNFEGKKLILSENRLNEVLGHEYELIEKFSAKELEGIKYEPPFDFARDVLSLEEQNRAFKVVFGEFVTGDDGTGIVHMAPAFGEDDLNIGKQYNLPFVQFVDLEGNLTTPKWKGMFARKADPLIIEDLKARGLLFKKESHEHDYPFCWRCDTPLLYYAKSSWFIKMGALKQNLIRNNETIAWFPESIKKGRFGKWLENINDWALSRERYWGTPLNIWRCKNCGHTEAIGSIKELRKKSIEDIPENIELHKPYVDHIHIKCPECGEEMERVPDVIDVWFDSGSMPFAQWHYPFENQKEFEENFPADFITEAVDQTRGWFYSLLAISTLVKDMAPYKSVMCLELILDEKGQKMSKSKGNVIDPWNILNVQGADAYRWAIYTASPPWIPRRFGPNVVQDALKDFIIPLRNVYSFFSLYANIDDFNPKDAKYIAVNDRNILDRWIIARIEEINKEVLDRFERFEITPITKDIQKFVDELSNWYVRRSRRRFWKSENDTDKISAYLTLYEVLRKLSVLLAPFTPFLSETLYQNLTKGIFENAKESVHLEDYPMPDESLIDKRLIDDMETLLEIVSSGRNLRKESKIKVRQPLSRIIVLPRDINEKLLLSENDEVIKEELNVKSIEFVDSYEHYVDVSLKLNVAQVGERLGSKIPEILKLLQEGLYTKDFLTYGKISLEADDEPVELGRADCFVELKGKEHFIGNYENGHFVFLDTNLTSELLEEGAAREIVHSVQNLRKEANLEISDRIILEINPFDICVEKFKDYIASETLANSITDVDAPFVEGDVKTFSKIYKIKLKKA